jgi:hypothetical protein
VKNYRKYFLSHEIRHFYKVESEMPFYSSIAPSNSKCFPCIIPNS